ncbi:MAG: valine--tRNA ligase [Thermoplasmata archaeon]|nr:valine--tRNA ligase [Thermoplasmata archaeon]
MAYDQKEMEARWQDWWEREEIYRFDPDRLEHVYSIDNPPRYASGGLHIGHATHYTHIDFAARFNRMRGYNVLFPLCFDVNGIPIEERVERLHGITRRDVDRHEFIKLCAEFAEANIREMIRQFKILGESMDPSAYYQTNAEGYRRLTQISFIRMFKQGLVYKGERPINWCPRCMTAMADAEVEYRPRKSSLHFIHFSLEDCFPLVIATTRPELLSTCQLIAINPDDERAAKLVGKRATVPYYGHKVEIVADENVDPTFGTGVVMICSIGDKDDLEWISKYGLALNIAIDEAGHMTAMTGEFEGMEVPRARLLIAERLKDMGALERSETVEQSVGTCWRCHHPMEYIVKPQWFIRTLDFKDAVLEAADEMYWFPEFMKVRLRDWVESLEWDWVVSRQRYFATPIPVWECGRCGEVVLAREEDCYVDPTRDKPPVGRCPKCKGRLVGCQDVFDTWMDSSISPLYNTYWERDQAKFEKLFPMSIRPQAHDIIRTWAFYTILRSKLLTGDRPFDHVMIDGHILAEDGTPMHASSGNAVDPLIIIDEHGSDPLRYFASTCALGEDNNFRMKDVTRGARLCRKLYNVNQYVGQALAGLSEPPSRPRRLRPVDHWIIEEFDSAVAEATDACEEYRFDVAMRKAEFFLWHQLADHYVEMVKFRLRDGIHDDSARYTLYRVGLGVTKMMAPFLPHVTEECYQGFYQRLEGGRSVHLSQWPGIIEADANEAEKGRAIKEAVTAIRRWKSENGIALNRPLHRVGIISRVDLSGCSGDIEGPTWVQDLLFPVEGDVERVPVEVKPRFDRIGPEFRGDAKVLIAAIREANPLEVLDGKAVEIAGRRVHLEDYCEVVTHAVYRGEEVDTEAEGSVTVLIPREQRISGDGGATSNPERRGK